MVEFVLCDDDKPFLDKIEMIIIKIMINKKIEYKISKFYDYDQKFLNNIELKDPGRIYILDIETPSNSGIIIGHKIRKIDSESPIIFLTGHEELGNLLLRKDLMFLAFINKYEELDIRLSNTINRALSLSNKKSFLKIENHGATYKISFDKIIYITRDSVERKTLIITNNNTHKVMKSLLEIKTLLDNRFVQTHRACVINKDRAEEINFKQKYILFDTGQKIELISNYYKMEDSVYVK